MEQSERELRRELEERLRFESLISELSARFVNLPPEAVDSEIERALQGLLDFFQCDRCGLLRVGVGEGAGFVTHAAYAGGVVQVPKDLDLAKLFPTAYDALINRGEVWSFERTSELPAEAEVDRRSYGELGVKSVLTIPLYSGADVKHVFTLNTLRAERRWPEALIPRLRLVGEIFVSALSRARMAKALQESEEMKSLAADAAGGALWGMDAATGFYWTTERGRALFQVEPEARLTLQRFLEVVHSEDRRWMEAAVARAVETGAPLDAEFRILRADGAVRWLHSRGLLRQQEGRPPYLMGLSRDITERKEMEEAVRASSREWRATFDSLLEPMWVLGPDFRIRLSNAAAANFLGLTQEELVGRSSYHLAGCAQTTETCPLARAMQTGRHEEGEMWDPQRGAWQFISVDPIRDAGGAVVGAVHRIRNITDYRQSQTELHTLREELYHVARTTTMGAMAAALAHELNQPLTAILSNAEAAQRLMARTPVDLEEVRAILSDIAADDRRAGAVIQGMRGFLKKGEPCFETLDPGELVRGVHGLLRSSALLHGVAVELDLAPGLPPVRGDRVQLQQVFLNLLTNGLEAMVPGTVVDRKLWVLGRSADGVVRVSVADTGQGIPEEWLEKIFQPFCTSKIEGMGMGLPIARSIVEAHGGRLWAETNPGGGATFTVELKIAEERA